MSNPQNLADQLGWCNTTRHHLQDLQGDIRHVERVFIESLAQMRGDQYLNELLARLQPLCNEFGARAQATVQHVEDSHISYVDQQANSVSNQLSAIMGLPQQF